MSSKQLSELPARVPLTGAELIHVVQGGNSRHATTGDLMALAGSGLLLGVDAVAATNYTFAVADNYRHKRFTAATAVSAVVPPNGAVPIPVGTRIRCTQKGAGQVTLTPGVGVTLTSADNALKSRVQGSVFEIEKVDTDEWDVLGDVTI